MRKRHVWKRATLSLFAASVLIFACSSENGNGDCDCGTRVCGSPQGKSCSCGTCQVPKTCSDEGQCVAPCCGGEAQHISVAGIAKDARIWELVSVAIAPVKPMDALGSLDPPRLDETISNAAGEFTTKCFDVADEPSGLLVLADDPGFDRTAGAYYPTGTGVVAWKSEKDKKCMEDAFVAAVPNTLVEKFKANIAGFDADQFGFVMGFVLDANGEAVVGAKIKSAKRPEMKVIYPSRDYAAFDSTTTTSNSTFIIPGPLELTRDITVEDPAGQTFEVYQAAARAGFCFFLPFMSKT